MRRQRPAAGRRTTSPTSPDARAMHGTEWGDGRWLVGPLPPIEASGTGVWAWVHLAFHGRCTTAAAGLAREGRGRHKCPAPLPLAVPPLLRSAQLPLALHSRARATRAPVTASGCSATAGATIPPKAAAAKKRRAAGRWGKTSLITQAPPCGATSVAHLPEQPRQSLLHAPLAPAPEATPCLDSPLLVAPSARRADGPPQLAAPQNTSAGS